VTGKTEKEIAQSLHELIEDVHVQGKNLKRLVDQHNDHERRLREQERRLKELEPMRDNYRTLIECNSAVMRELDGIRERQDTLIESASKSIEHALRADVLDMRRELRTELARLSRLLEERPCVAGAPCPEGMDK
jgi:hypothetical protein